MKCTYSLYTEGKCAAADLLSQVTEYTLLVEQLKLEKSF